jgi:hypothetical protein
MGTSHQIKPHCWAKPSSNERISAKTCRLPHEEPWAGPSQSASGSLPLESLPDCPSSAPVGSTALLCANARGHRCKAQHPGFKHLQRVIEPVLSLAVSSPRLIAAFPATAIGAMKNSASVAIAETLHVRESVRLTRGQQEGAGTTATAAGEGHCEVPGAPLPSRPRLRGLPEAQISTRRQSSGRARARQPVRPPRRRQRSRRGPYRFLNTIHG